MRQMDNAFRPNPSALAEEPEFPVIPLLIRRTVAPLSAALIAAESAARPPPTTNTSQ